MRCKVQDALWRTLSEFQLTDFECFFHLFCYLQKTEKVVRVSCVLHNYLRTEHHARYTPPGSLDKETDNGTIRLADWRNGSVIKPLGQQGGNRYGSDAKK